METIEYKNFEWYIINETDKEKLLFLKDCFTNEQIAKYFLDKSMVDEDYDVRFSEYNSPWFRDSYIRSVLNTVFLNDLDASDLNEMETSVSLNGQSVTTRDCIRLITIEEAEKLPKEVLKTNRKYGYWTMSPCGFAGSNAFVFCVLGSGYPGYLSFTNVFNAGGVRPVVSLKSETLKSINEFQTEEGIEELIRIIYVLQNIKIDNKKWQEFLAKYNSIKGLDGSIDFQVLRNLFAKSLTTPILKPMSSRELNIYQEQRTKVLNDLEQSKKLILNY